MLEFNEPEVSDRSWASEMLSHAKNINCEYTFSALYMWRKSYNTFIARYKDFLICKWGRGKNINYSVPIGTGNFKEAVEEIIIDAKHHGVVPRIYGVTDVYKKILDSEFENSFEYSIDEGEFDYIYSSEDLATLSGKKYHSKRNHISNFIKNNPDWEFRELCSNDIDDCLELHRNWMESKEIEIKDYEDEYIAAKDALNNFDNLKLRGGIIRASSKIVAYTFGEELNKDCFVCHIEKAPADIQGAFAIINREFAKTLYNAGYKYINREEDLGIDGLRRAKQSYHPLIWLKKEIAKYKG